MSISTAEPDDPSAQQRAVAASPVTSHVAARAPTERRYARQYLALDDLERAARRRLPRMIYGFIAGGAETEGSVRANRASFQRYALVPHVLTDTSARSTAVTLFGKSYATPFGIAPLGAAALCAWRGDLQLARGALQAGLPMILSATSLIPLEQVRAAGAAWFQAYLPGDPARIEALVARAAAAGYEALVLTADVPVPANRENNLRNGFSLPLIPGPRLYWQAVTHPRWSIGTLLRTLSAHGMPHFENMDAARGPPILSRNLVRELGARDRLCWEHLQLIRRHWKGPLVVKGILSIEDAVRARDCGADGLILSNHGGRQLDGAIAPLQVLPQIAARLPDMQLMLDGGVRRGTDVLKALALGARFVFLGRPFLYAAALGGARLVHAAAHLLTQEISRDMALMGLNDLTELTPGHVRPWALAEPA
ncbi:MAG TPA: alpha-hydroxy acid oxidase [Steroidobacteraceae bacterium]|jgi:L-lactate dehydrogenase (cytochrome)|nr:alpha-hydroxy acid oxidase [Steroidobacteraceae bacterium]